MFYKVIRFMINLYISIIYRFEIYNAERIPNSGPVIICSNHIHWGDPVILACKSTKRTVHFLGKAELFKNRIFTWVLNHLNVIPVKRGKSDIGAIKRSLKILQDRHTLGIFPEGTRVKEGEKKDAEAGLALLAIKSKALIVPIGIMSSYKLGSKIMMNVGNPISLDKYYGKKVHKEEMEKISYDILVEIRKLAQG